MALIINEDHPTFKAVSPRTWIEQTEYLRQPFHTLLVAFTTQRRGLLRILQPLPRKSWARLATVTGTGAPLQVTVQHYAQKLATHERRHLIEIERTLRVLRKS